jgi:nicotinamidase-related amidase
MPRSLIIIDLINEFLHPDGKITPQGMGKFCEKYKTIENTKKLIDAFRTNKEEVIWVHLGFHENYDNCSTISPRFKWTPSAWILRENTWSADFLEELGYDSSEKTFTKTRISSFYKTGLEEYLWEKWITEIVVSGVATDLAVSSITRDAHDRDIVPTVISDACGTISIEHHDAALIGISKLGNVLTTEEFLAS